MDGRLPPSKKVSHNFHTNFQVSATLSKKVLISPPNFIPFHFKKNLLGADRLTLLHIIGYVISGKSTLQTQLIVRISGFKISSSNLVETSG